MKTEVNENSFEAKKDCFGYCKENNTCSVLNKLWCKVERCKFYKTKKQFESERAKYGFTKNFCK